MKRSVSVVLAFLLVFAFAAVAAADETAAESVAAAAKEALAALSGAFAETPEATEAPAETEEPEEPGIEEYVLSFDDGSTVTAYKVNPWAYTDDWDVVRTWSKNTVSFNGTKINYIIVNGELSNVLGMALEIEVNKKSGFREGEGLQLGLMTGKKGTRGDRANVSAAEVGERDWIAALCKEPGKYNGMIVTSYREKKDHKTQFGYGIWNLRVFFADLASAEAYAASLQSA
ncbi:MAG: hypothetical protein Q4C53_03820 [Clostridia bacterium]|nr:hypothetical protein [Clostridia bacterium]